MGVASCGEHGCAVGIFAEQGGVLFEGTGSDVRLSKDGRRILASVADSQCNEKGATPCVAEYNLVSFESSVKRLVDNPRPPLPSSIQPLTDPDFLVGTWRARHQPLAYVFEQDGRYRHFGINWREDGTWEIDANSTEDKGTWEFRSGKLYMDGEETIAYKMNDTHVYFGDIVDEAMTRRHT